MSSEITPSTARNRYWRPTAPACQIFQVLYVRPSVVWTMESSILRRRPVKPSLDDHSIVQGGYRQWFLALSTPGHGRSFWTNWRCIKFLLLYQLPLRSKGRPGYRCNFELIRMGLCEPRVTKSLVDFLCPFIFPK